MSTPTHDPLVVNTKDGASWTRRAVTRDGRGLYAVSDAPACCPEYVMATLPELAEHGIAGMADVLPVPVGPVRTLDVVENDLIGANLARWEEEQDNARLRLALASAQRGRREQRARVARLEAERHSTNEVLSEAAEALRRNRDRIQKLASVHPVIFRAAHDSIVMGLYATREAAQAHCEAKVHQEEPVGSIRHLSWVADDVGDLAEYELHITPAATGDLIRGTGYLVTPLEVATAYDPDADE